MKTITITKAEKIEIPQRQKWEKNESYNRYVYALEQFNKDCEDITVGKKVTIKRKNQAINCYGYARVSSREMMPYHYLSRINEKGEFYFTRGYSNTDYVEIN